MLVSLIWLLAGRAYLEAVVTRLFMHLFPLGNETAGLTITAPFDFMITYLDLSKATVNAT
jgi:hypothetical protein